MGNVGVTRSHLQNSDAAAEISHHLAGRIFLAPKLDRKTVGLAANRVRGVEGAGGIDKKSGAIDVAVFIDAVNSDNRFGRALKDISDFATDRDGGLILSGDRPRRKESCQNCRHPKPRCSPRSMDGAIDPPAQSVSLSQVATGRIAARTGSSIHNSLERYRAHSAVASSENCRKREFGRYDGIDVAAER